MIGENMYRSDFQGEEVLSTIASAVLISTLTPFIGFVRVSGPIEFVSQNLNILFPSDEVLLIKKIEKEPIKKSFSNPGVFLANNNEMFDFKYWRNTKEGKQLVYFYGVGDDRLVLGAADLVYNDILHVRKYTYWGVNNKGTRYKIYSLSDASLLLEIINGQNSGFQIINYDDFE